MPKSLPEVFASNASIASWVSKELKKGTLRKLGSRLYTTNQKEPLETLARRHAWFIVQELFPGSIIVDRTALEHQPSSEGSIFIVSTKKRPLILPGLAIYPRKGAPPLEEDRPFMQSLYLSCPARAYLENLSSRRARRTGESRILSRPELEERLEKLLQQAGPEALNALRESSKKIAPLLNLEKEGKVLEGLIGTLLGTHNVPLSAPLAQARARGRPYDPRRLDLFQKLYAFLASEPPVTRYLERTGSSLPFFEAYFSNFIEGTEFQVDEAAAIIFKGKIPKNRPEDAHDILGTYHLVSDRKEMSVCPKTADELVAILKKRHQILMQARLEVHPGRFKTAPNQAGSTVFVAPHLVEGTLLQGFQWLQALTTPFHRAIYMMFLIAEVHPFTDGNGRCARVMMNAELLSQNQVPILIPTILRGNYLAALKALSHEMRPEPLVRLLDFAQKYTALIDWREFETAYRTLLATHAFEDSAQAEFEGKRLRLPSK